METKKILGIIFSCMFVVAFGLVLTWGVINFNKVQEAMSGTQIYNATDLDNAYKDGYNTALENKTEYDELINNYRDTITNLNDSLSQSNSQISTLQSANNDCLTQITNLNSIKSQNEQTILSLEESIRKNNGVIDGLNSQIGVYQEQVTSLTQSNNQNVELIASLNTQIQNLQTLSNQLQLTNDLNLATINNLNNQIVSLNNQITELKNQVQLNDTNLSTLNNKIATLERSVAYYEQYIASLETGEQIVAAFEFNGSVYSIQVLTTGAKASVETPTSTDYIIFNGWKVNGEFVDLSEFKLYANTKFIADITYKYDVNFVVDGTTISSQIVTKDGYPTSPADPVKSGYVFDGWTTDGNNLVNPNTIKVQEQTTYVAVFTKTYTATFTYEGNVLSTQVIRNGECASAPSVDDTEHKTFNGWLLNNIAVNVENYNITRDITFTADIIYSYDVQFVVQTSVYNTQIVQSGYSATVPTEPIISTYLVFDSWCIDGVSVDVANYPITANTTFVAKLTSRFEVKFMVENSVYSTDIVNANSTATKPNNPTLSGKTFDGWSLDGINIVDVRDCPITANTIFIAVFTETQYTLTIDYRNGSQTISITQLPNTTYSLPTPTFEGFDFIGWRIGNGQGTLSGNVFTFSTSDCYVYACYNYCEVSIVSYTTGTVVYNGQSYDLNGQGNSGHIGGGGGGTMTLSLEDDGISTMAFIISPDFLELPCKNTDSLTVTISGGTLMLDVESDGTITKTYHNKTSYTISWAGATYVNITVERSNVSFV